MRKFYVVFMVVFALALTACQAAVTTTPTPVENTTTQSSPDSTTDTTVPTDTVPSTESAAITFSVFGDPAEKEAYETLVTEFEKVHPEIDVTLSHIPGQGDYQSKLAADFAAGTSPDVSLMNHRRIGPLVANGQLEQVGPYLDASDVVEPADYYDIALDAFRWQGTVTCIPQNISSLVVYYNTDLFDAAGLEYPTADWTWDEFIATAQALTQDNDGDGVTEQYGLGTDVSFFRITPFIIQNQGAVVDDINMPTRLTMNRQVSIEALQWVVDWQVEHHIVPNREEEASQDSESRFIADTTAMYLNSRRAVPTYREIEAFNWDVAPLPMGVQKASLLHSDGFCMSAATANKDAAWTFIEYANSVEGQTILAATGRTVPSLREVAESPAFLNPDLKPASNQVFLDVIPYITRVPTTSTWGDVEKTATEEFERAFYGDISAEEAANNMVIRTEEYFNLANLILTPTP